MLTRERGAWPRLLISLASQQNGCPVLRVLCEGRDTEMLAHVGLFPSLPSKSYSPGIIDARPFGKLRDGSCKKRKGTLSVEMLHIVPLKVAIRPSRRHRGILCSSRRWLGQVLSAMRAIRPSRLNGLITFRARCLQQSAAVRTERETCLFDMPAAGARPRQRVAENEVQDHPYRIGSQDRK